MFFINSEITTYSTALKLFKKILLKEFYQRVDVVKGRLDINDRELSQATGQTSNWFNDGKNNMEDIRISSFLRILASLTERKNLTPLSDSMHGKIDTDEIFTSQIIWIASIYNAIKEGIVLPDVNSLYGYLKEFPDRLRTLNATLSNLKKMQHKLTIEELIYLEELLNKINN